MKNGTLFLIPTYLDDANDASFVAPMVLDVIKSTRHFAVENERSARRYISSLKLGLDISALHFELLNKDTNPTQLEELLKPLSLGEDIGVISEAGLPGLADPGNLAVAYAHKNHFRVVPLPGASAIQTALVASGFNGQQFTFHGYLPIQKPDRIRAIQGMESILRQSGFTQLFMETPFRNMALFDDLIAQLHPKTLLHISAGLFSSREMTLTQPVSWWKGHRPELHKIPSVFAIGSFA